MEKPGQDVIVTAGNVVSPLGFTTEENFQQVIQGKSGLRMTGDFNFSDEQFCAATFSNDIVDNRFTKFGDVTRFTRLEKICIISISDVLSRAHVSLDRPDTLLVYSTTKGNIDLLDSNKHGKPDDERIYLTGLVKILSDYFHCTNKPVIVSNACTSGLLALIIAMRFLKKGLYRNIVVAGGDIVSAFTLSGFHALSALSDEPCKPFDVARKGINLGEAASSMVLTTDPGVFENPVKILAGASTNDANHISGPSRDGEGLYQAVKKTLASFPSVKIDHISAHGTGTKYNDEMESIAFSRAGLEYAPANSLKGYFGHTFGAAGLLETVISLEGLKQNILVASAGFEQSGVSGNINVIKKTEKKNLVTLLKTSSGFGGSNASVLFSK